MLGKRQIALLVEAARRFTHFHPDVPLQTAWTGLGNYSEYKPAVIAGLMTYATRPNPRYMTWFRLTEKGAEIVQKLLNAGLDYQRIESGEVTIEEIRKVLE